MSTNHYFNNYAATKTDTVVRKGVYVLATNKGTVSCITLTT
jgi:hypothetical protein